MGLKLLIRDLGERELIKRVWQLLKRRGLKPGGITESFDDAVGIKLGDVYLLLSNDGVSDKTDMLPGMSWRDLGWRLGIACLSDLAAKGAKPLGMLISLNIPSDLELRIVEEIYEGIADVASEYKFEIWGGDVGEARDIVLDGFLIGMASRPLWRKGIKPGDLIAVTGDFGLTGAAFHYLLNNGRQANDASMCRILEAAYRPTAKLNAGLKLASIKGVVASIDSSDGLAVSLHELAYVNNLGIMIEHVPIAKEVIEYAKVNDLDPLDLALYGGEEYELIFAMRPEYKSVVLSELESVKLNPIIIGKAIRNKGVFLRKGKKLIRVRAAGWEHLRK